MFEVLVLPSLVMAKLFQRVNPHIDMGQRSPQVLGEELLDYRNCLGLSVEVNRGSDGWLQRNLVLSTGEGRSRYWSVNPIDGYSELGRGVSSTS